MNKEDLILNLLKETRADQKESSEDISDIKTDIAVIKTEVNLNREDLEEHMEQTRALKELTITVKNELVSMIETVDEHHTNNNLDILKRLSASYLLKLIVSVASGIGVISGAIYGVIKLFKGL